MLSTGWTGAGLAERMERVGRDWRNGADRRDGTARDGRNGWNGVERDERDGVGRNGVNGTELHGTGPDGTELHGTDGTERNGGGPAERDGRRRPPPRMGGMGAEERPEWVVREDAGLPVLIALYLRQVLGLRYPDALPHVRGVEPAALSDDAALEDQWRRFWDLTVEPLAHPSPVPLDLVDGFETLVVLPTEGFEELHAAIAPHGADAVAFARDAHERYRAGLGKGASYRGYASAIAQHERLSGRPAHSFELNVHVLPLAQRGVWWIGALTVAVTDGLRGDVVAFDSAIAPIIADVA